MEDFLAAMLDVRNSGAWPSEGPRGAQSAWFLDAFALGCAVLGKIEERKARAMANVGM